MSYTTGLPGQNDDEPARSWQASAPPPPPEEDTEAATPAATEPPAEEPAPLWQSTPSEPSAAPAAPLWQSSASVSAPEPVDEAETPTVSTEPTDWMSPDPVEAVEPLDPPYVERTEPEEIEVPASEAIDEVIEEADEDEDEIVFDLASLSIEERRHLTMRMTGANVTHLWEAGTDLVVSVQDAPVVETYLDEVRNPDGFADDELAYDGDDDVDDEAIYNAMSQLYVAADKLMQKPGDDATAGDFYLASDDVDGLPAPFGFDPRVWQQVLGLTDGIVAALDTNGDPDTIGAQARQLRELLVNYV